MLKFANKLSDDYEYAFLYWGQSNANPQGLRTDGETEEPALALRSNGTDVVLVGALTSNTGLQTVSAIDEYTTTFVVGWVGAELRMGRPGTPGVGYGVVTAQTAASLTINFTKAPPAGTLQEASITFKDSRNNQYPNVRVLTPWLPEEGGAYPSHVPPQLPGATVDSDIASYEDLGQFLPFTFMEGSSGFGISDAGGTGPVAAADGTTFTWTHTVDVNLFAGWLLTVVHGGGTSTVTVVSNTGTVGTFAAWDTGGTPTGTPADWTYTLTFGSFGLTHATGGGAATGSTSSTFLFTQAITPGLLAGGFVYVEWTEDETGAKKVSWSDVGDNIALSLTGLVWQGDGDPAAGFLSVGVGPLEGSIDRWEAWTPHYFDSPHARLPGPGFRYPSNESSPLIGVRNRARNITGWVWNFNRFGAILPTFWPVANAMGRRVNIIPLAVSASSIMITHTLFGGGPCGWWDPAVRADWNPQTPNGLCTRISRLLNNIAAKANSADGNGKPIKILGFAGLQGEAEAISVFGRTNYKNLLPMFYNWLKNEVHEAGLNYFDTPEELVVVHAGLPTSPWEIGVSGGGGGDTEGEVNSAITNYAAKIPFAGTIDTNDSPQKSGEEIHFDGTGEAINGRLMGAQLINLVDNAVSKDDDLTTPIVAEICNVALSIIGESAKITNLLTDVSEGGVRCRRYFTLARDLLLQRCSWSFATRRLPLDPVDDARNAEWACAYGVPDNAVRIFAILPDNAGDDISIHLNSGTIKRDAAGLLLAEGDATAYVPQPFTKEQDDDGHDIIYTNVEGAICRYNVLVTDATSYSPQFRYALSMQIAAFLAGVTLKGDDGTLTADVLIKAMERQLGEAKVQDAMQQDTQPKQVVSWMAARKSYRRN